MHNPDFRKENVMIIDGIIKVKDEKATGSAVFFFHRLDFFYCIIYDGKISRTNESAPL